MGRLRVERICREVAPLVCGDRVLATRCYVASSLMGRLVGLLATPDLARHEALWIESCASVHSVGLRGRIGVAFVDERGRVLRVVDPMPRGRIVGARGARAAIELAAGNLEGVRFGDALALEWERPRPRRHEEEREDGGGGGESPTFERCVCEARDRPRQITPEEPLRCAYSPTVTRVPPSSWMTTPRFFPSSPTTCGLTA